MGHLRFLTAGESHGKALVAIIEGIPAGLPIDAAWVDTDLGRRMQGYGRGARMKIEQDRIEWLAGVRAGETLGSPIAMLIANRDWKNWEDVMAAEGTPGEERRRRVARPRPGHADLVGVLKYDRTDARDILERASARETTARVACGAVARRLLAELGVEVGSHVVSLGGIVVPALARSASGGASEVAYAPTLSPPSSAQRASGGASEVAHAPTLSPPSSAQRASGGASEVAHAPNPDSVGASTTSETPPLNPSLRDALRAGKLNELSDASPVRVLDRSFESEIIARIDAAKKDGDTLGGEVEVVAIGLPVGLGSHVHWDRKLDGRLASMLMSIPAVKGVEIGLGFEAARRPGSAVHDPIVSAGTNVRGAGFAREGNNAGGLEGGMTTGEPLVVRVAMKPISTLMSPLKTVHLDTGAEANAQSERSDVTAVPAMGVIAEALVALVLAEAMLEKFGGDSLAEMRRNLDGYLTALAYRRSAMSEPEPSS